MQTRTSQSTTRSGQKKHPPSIVIVGASSAIAAAIISHYLTNTDLTIIAFSQSDLTQVYRDDRVTTVQLDYTAVAIQAAVNLHQDAIAGATDIFICNGILHDKETFPEKSLQQLSEDNYLKLMRVNAFIPMLFIANFVRCLARDWSGVISCLSARIGSIGDNKSGGWYSYRASKAALNMSLKSAAIELARSHPKAKLLAFHPGTTDTPLSQPFQARVAPDKLFSPAFVAQRLVSLLPNLDSHQGLSFRDWDHQNIPW
ncbi:MAG: SDR family NAD(P)-dependent oxidoreductase [Gammaproteobacteria bacterium]|nr:SDR family NAD(P)-dependent oxidoreductase [Gammaproteobacteria bacterium]